MRIQKMQLEHGAMSNVTTPVTARYMQLIQLKRTDAARVSFRVEQHPSLWDFESDGRAALAELAVGDRVPLPLTDDIDGPMALKMDLLIEYGPGIDGPLNDGTTRCVLAFGERDDGSDLWFPHQRWEDVEQLFELKAIDGADVAINEPLSDDYSEKDWETVPCKGFNAAQLELEAETYDRAGVMIAAFELGESDIPLHVLPLYILTSADPADVNTRKRTVHFWLTGTADRLKFRVWRMLDATPTSVRQAKLRLYTRRTQSPDSILEGGQLNISGTSNSIFGGCLYASPLGPPDYRSTFSFENCALSPGNVTGLLYGYANVGMDSLRDQHRLIANASAGGVAPGATGSASLTNVAIHSSTIFFNPLVAGCIVRFAMRRYSS